MRVTVYLCKLPAQSEVNSRQMPEGFSFVQGKNPAVNLQRTTVRLLLRHAVGEKCFISPVSKGPHGKPYFVEEGAPYFSFSHGDGLALCALSQTEVGADAEISSRIMPQKVREKVFSEEEIRQIHCHQDAIRLWTLKESYVKFTGQGLSTDLAGIRFSLAPLSGPEGVHVWQNEWEKWQISVCTKEKCHVVVQEVPFATLLSESIQ